MKALDPVLVTHLFPEERAAQLDVLRSLDAEQWERPTACEGWSVADVARHLVADDLGRLAWQRDGHSASRFSSASADTFEAELRDFINRQNEEWVETTRRLSPRVVIGLLEWSGRETQAHFESLDPDAPGLGVAWANDAVCVRHRSRPSEFSQGSMGMTRSRRNLRASSSLPAISQ